MADVKKFLIRLYRTFDPYSTRLKKNLTLNPLLEKFFYEQADHYLRNHPLSEQKILILLYRRILKNIQGILQNSDPKKEYQARNYLERKLLKTEFYKNPKINLETKLTSEKLAEGNLLRRMFDDFVYASQKLEELGSNVFTVSDEKIFNVEFTSLFLSQEIAVKEVFILTNFILENLSKYQKFLKVSYQIPDGLEPQDYPNSFVFPPRIEEEYGTADSFLGRGTYGKVLSTTGGYAIKIIQGDDDTSISHTGLVEPSIMKHMQKMGAQNLMRLEDFEFDQEGTVYLVMEKGIPVRCFPTNLSDDQIRMDFLSICQGIDELHRAEILHLDIKQANCIRLGERIVLTDFGLSTTYNCVQDLGGSAFTPEWKPPELSPVIGYLPAKSSDIWALGVVLYMWQAKKSPFGNNRQNDLSKIIEKLGFPSEEEWPDIQEIPILQPVKNVKGEAKKFFGEIPEKSARKLLKKIFRMNPELRPTIAEILDDPYFEDLRRKAKNPDCEANAKKTLLSVNLKSALLSPENSKEKMKVYLRLIRDIIPFSQEFLQVNTLTISYGVSLFNWLLREHKIQSNEMFLAAAACISIGSYFSDREHLNAQNWIAEIREQYKNKAFTIVDFQEMIVQILVLRDLDLIFSTPYSLAISMFEDRKGSDPDDLIYNAEIQDAIDDLTIGLLRTSLFLEKSLESSGLYLYNEARKNLSSDDLGLEIEEALKADEEFLQLI